MNIYNVSRMARTLAALLVGVVPPLGPLLAQPSRNFLQRAFGTASSGEQPLLSRPLAPGFSYPREPGA